MKGVNLGDVMREASEANGGKAAVTTLQLALRCRWIRLRSFIKMADELVGRQLKGEKLASKNPA